MDYDDNDCQNKQFQLGGEDNNNFLRPFSLPKFDLDEHLPVHLRFGSLGEPEDILGIRVQEGSNWIQDFSSGGREIEFSSGAAESCVITMQNNIWSEATSTESVEMLLKSVGEDDMLTNKTTSDSITDQVLNDANNDTKSSPQESVSCMEGTTNSGSLPGIENSIILNRDSSVAASHVHDARQTSEDGKVVREDHVGMHKCSLNDGTAGNSELNKQIIQLPVKVLEDDLPKASPFIDRGSHVVVSEGCSLDGSILEGKAPDGCGSSFATNDLHMMDLSTTHIDFDGPLNVAVRDRLVSLDPGSEKSHDHLKDSGASEITTTRIQEHRLQTGSNTDYCNPDQYAVVDNCSPSRNSSSLRTKMDSPDLKNPRKELAHSGSSDRLLEVVVDEVRFSVKSSDALASQIVECPLSQASGDSAQHHSEEHAHVGCISEKNSSSLGTQVDSSVVMDECKELVRDGGSDGLLDVIVDGLRFSNKDADVGKVGGGSLEGGKEHMAIISPGKTEETDGVGSHDTLYEPIQDYGGREFQTSLLIMKEKNDSRSYLYEDYKKQELPELAERVSAVNEIVETQITDAKESKERESHGQVLAPIVKSSDGGLNDDVRSPLIIVNDSGNEIRNDGPVPDSDKGTTPSLSMSANMKSMEVCNKCSPSEHKASLGSPSHEEDSRPCYGSVTEGRADDSDKDKVLESFPEKFPEKLVVLESIPLEPAIEAKSCCDVAAESLPSLEVRATCAKLNDMAMDSKQKPPCTDPHPSENEPLVGKSTGDVRSDCNPCMAKERGTFDGLAGSGVCVSDVAGSGQEASFEDNTSTSFASSKCAAISQPAESSVDKNLLEVSGGPSVAIDVSELPQGVEKQNMDQGSLDQTTPFNDPHNTNAKKSLGQSKSNCDITKESSEAQGDKSFSFEVGGVVELPGKDAGGGLEPFSDSQPRKSGPATPVAFGGEKHNSGVTERVLENEIVGSKVQGSVMKGAGKEKGRPTSSAKRKPSKESQTPKRTTEKSKRKAISSPLEELQQHCPSQGSTMKPSNSAIVQPSSLPDLNTATSGASLFNQPFTDAQQVQLRAQILVYGYIIQGIPPEEACMVSAFGDGGGGRITWEGVWRAFSEKYHSQKSPIFQTPSRTATKPLDQASTCSPLQARVNSTACQTGNKSLSPYSSTISFWSMPTQDMQHSNISRGLLVDPNRMPSLMHGYHSPHITQHAANITPRLGQTAVSASLVSLSNSSGLGTSTQPPTSRSVETIHLPHASAPHISGERFISPGNIPSIGSALAVSATPAMQTDAVSPSPYKQTSSEPKSRKKKKAIASDALKHMLVGSQPLLESAPASASTKPLGFQTSINLSNRASSASLISNVAPMVSPTHFQIVNTCHPDRAILSEETCTKIEQARQQAEDAAAFASAAVRHSESIWSQLAVQRSSGLVLEVEQKLASAAVAAAAAASVAKAAAAAAKVAVDAALQAKLLTDEALASNRTSKTPAVVEAVHPHQEGVSANPLPGSDSKHNDITRNSSIISVAREGARRRVEAASAAAKRAENLDAIVKAAELAAGAVSQAGAIVAMGDPLPFSLNDILDAGPENYWKGQQSQKENLVKANIFSEMEFGQGLNSQDQSPQPNKEGCARAPNDLVRLPPENLTGVSGTTSVAFPDNALSRDQIRIDADDNNIREGSAVEILSAENGLGSIWYPARVQEIKDGQAYVCYNTLVADGGSGKLKTWVALEGEGLKAPIVRVAHPLTAVKYEGTRKRRREVVATCSWNVGDRIDAWIRDGWWEGVITEKSNEDDTKLTVCFSAGGGSAIVRSWDLRPSLIWKDGAWIEWSQLKEKNVLPMEGDTPKEKRQKLDGSRGKNSVESESLDPIKSGKNKIADDIRKPDKHVPLVLSAKEQIFSVGRGTQEEGIPEKAKRSALQKEGSRVVFGVPKPGRKRKFMDVSKHCVVDGKEKVKEGSDSIKFAKYLMPQSSHGWKAPPKVDQRGKRGVESKPSTTKPLKSQITQFRKTVDRDGSSTSMLFVSSNGGSTGVAFNTGLRSASKVHKKSEQNIHLEVALSSSMHTADDPDFVRQLQPTPGVPSDNRWASNAEADLAKKGNESTTVEKSLLHDDMVSNVDNSAKSFGAMEPRRSNRRIQPTSRLLEGLQSSLMITKIPSAPQDKVTKTAQKATGRTLRTRG